MIVHDGALQHNLATYGAFAATERLLMELVKAGADRQEMHELIRQHSLAAWDAIQRGEDNPLGEALAIDPTVLAFLPAERVGAVLEKGLVPAAVSDVADQPGALPRTGAGILL